MLADVECLCSSVELLFSEDGVDTLDEALELLDFTEEEEEEDEEDLSEEEEEFSQIVLKAV